MGFFVRTGIVFSFSPCIKERNKILHLKTVDDSCYQHTLCFLKTTDLYLCHAILNLMFLDISCLCYNSNTQYSDCVALHTTENL